MRGLAWRLAGCGPAAEASLWGLYLASLAWFVWIFIGIWRSAGRYGGPRLWAVLARAGVCLGICAWQAKQS